MPELSALPRLRTLLREISDLEAAAAILDWDQATYMPEAGAVSRGRQMALLARLAHERRMSDELGSLLRELSSLEDAGDSHDAALVRTARREHERALREPPELVGELRDHVAATFVAWTKAKERDDFGALVPLLARTVELSRRLAECHPRQDSIADPMIDRYDPGTTAKAVSELFATLRAAIVPLVRAIAARPAVDDRFLAVPFDVERQIEFAHEVAAAFGYDFARGRRDETFHPFMTRFSAGDVRITTRFRADEFPRGLFGAFHESGHAIYEQHVDLALDGSPLGQGASAGVHESQSRLWENIVGRSEAFWRHFYPRLCALFPDELGEVEVGRFVRAINAVKPSLIRVTADEVTYNLHVMLRFDLEQALLEGRLAVRELPDAWAERMRADLGLTPPSDATGVMQDVHWYAEPIGGSFQGYALGNVMSAQFYEAAVTAHPAIPEEIGRGELGTLRGWLAGALYRHGASYLPAELIERATGSPLSTRAYVRYLESKYSGLYGLSARGGVEDASVEVVSHG